ncbi:MAG: hypothetical protein K0R14_1532 [Burkholderiales bacterium]|nr:hypothetical protein [Burkholderiales bacterium]
MRTLRLYLNNRLDQSINWTMVDNNEEVVDSGSSLWDEFAGFENVQVEIYLNASCCTVFKTTKVHGISNKQLTDELILGLIEEDLADDIEDLKPIMMRLEENLAYIAIFNRVFYEQLIQLDKPIKLVQSYVYSTNINEDAKQWTLYLSPEQNFLRISQFQYYLLDDVLPVPKLLENLLTNSFEKPSQILVYSDSPQDFSEYQKKFGIDFVQSTEPLKFGIPIWNFYNQKSSSFKLKIEKDTQKSLLRLLKTAKYFAVMIAVFWLINILNIYINKSRVESELKKNLGKISKVDTISTETLSKISPKLFKMAHDRALPDELDFTSMFYRFLRVVPTTDPDDITQIEYNLNDVTLTIFLRDFATDQFHNYRDMFKSSHIIAELTDFKTYTRTHKKAKTDNKAEAGTPPEDNIEDHQASKDTKWVLTLRLAWLYQTL